LRPVAMLGRPAVASFPATRPRHKGSGASGGTGGGGARARDTMSFFPVNASLQGVFDVLKHEAAARPEARKGRRVRRV